MSHREFPEEKQTITSNTHIVFATPAQPTATPLVSNNLLSFTIYPTTAADLADNEFLWHVIRDASFTPTAAHPVLSRRLALTYTSLPTSSVRLFALAFPTPLASFLRAVSLEEMHSSIIYMLADAAQGEDEAGLRDMRNHLAPTVWTALGALMRRSGFDVGGLSCSNASFMLDAALQTAQAHDYWKIETDAALFVESSHISTFEQQCDPAHLSHLRAHATVLASLYRDWATYASHTLIWESFLQTANPAPARQRARRNAALDTMMTLVRQKRHSDTWERVRELRRCAETHGNFLASLPPQVVEHLLIPLLVLDHHHPLSIRSPVTSTPAIDQGG